MFLPFAVWAFCESLSARRQEKRWVVGIFGLGLAGVFPAIFFAGVASLWRQVSLSSMVSRGPSRSWWFSLLSGSFIIGVR